MPVGIPYNSPPQALDTVVIAANPFISWMRQIDSSNNPGLHKNYDYNRLPPRRDRLDEWFFATASVVRISGDMALVQADKLGKKQLPVKCLRVLERAVSEQ